MARSMRPDASSTVRLRGGRPSKEELDIPSPPPFKRVKSEDVLHYRAHNAHRLAGFREDYDTSLTNALLRLHGETFNIWSHLAGSFLFVIPRLVAPPIETAPHWLSVCLWFHALVGVGCGLASAAFHVCESWPTETYSKMLALDYTMAYVATVSHSCLIVAYEMREQQTYLIALILVPLLLLGAHGTRFFLVMQGQSNTTDSAIVIALTLFMPFLFAVPFLLRAALFPNPLTPILIRWLLAFAGATGSWILQIPERFFPPGTFDYFGSSHNVMHVLVLVVWQQLHWGVRGLLENDSPMAMHAVSAGVPPIPPENLSVSGFDGAFTVGRLPLWLAGE